MPKKDTENVKDDLTAPNPVPELKDEVITLRLKQNAYWQGVFHFAGDTFDYPRADALELLRTTDLFEAK